MADQSASPRGGGHKRVRAPMSSDLADQVGPVSMSGGDREEAASSGMEMADLRVHEGPPMGSPFPCYNRLRQQLAGMGHMPPAPIWGAPLDDSMDWKKVRDLARTIPRQWSTRWIDDLGGPP